MKSLLTSALVAVLLSASQRGEAASSLCSGYGSAASCLSQQYCDWDASSMTCSAATCASQRLQAFRVCSEAPMGCLWNSTSMSCSTGSCADVPPLECGNGGLLLPQASTPGCYLNATSNTCNNSPCVSGNGYVPGCAASNPLCAFDHSNGICYYFEGCSRPQSQEACEYALPGSPCHWSTSSNSCIVKKCAQVTDPFECSIFPALCLVNIKSPGAAPVCGFGACELQPNEAACGEAPSCYWKKDGAICVENQDCNTDSRMECLQKSSCTWSNDLYKCFLSALNGTTTTPQRLRL